MLYCLWQNECIWPFFIRFHWKMKIFMNGGECKRVNTLNSWCKFMQVYFHFVKYTETGSGTWQLHHLRLNQMLRQCVLELQTHRNTRSHISGSGDAEACPVHARGLIAGLRGQRVTNCATHGGQHWCGLLPKHWNTTWRSVKKDKWTPTPTADDIDPSQWAHATS